MTQDRYMRPGVSFARGKVIEEIGELQEALGKLQAALGKSIRWGWGSSNPELPVEEREKNIDWVLREIVDVRDAVNSLESQLLATHCTLKKELVSVDPPTPIDPPPRPHPSEPFRKG